MPRRLLKNWSGSRVEASRVALILALAFVARLAEIATDISAALRALASAKIHSNAAHSSFNSLLRVNYLTLLLELAAGRPRLFLC